MRFEANSGLRRSIGALAIAFLGASMSPGCDDSVPPEPPKSGNLAPETYLSTQSDSLATVLYKVPLRWLGSDADGRVVSFRLRWTCNGLSGGACPSPTDWIETTALSDTFPLLVPGGTGDYTFEVAAVDNDGVADPSPARQRFSVYNTPPVASFAPGSLPSSTLPAITFYLDAVDPDSTADPDDRDSRRGLLSYRAWLDGNEAGAQEVPLSVGAVTFGPDDFQGRYGGRTVFAQALDDGSAASLAVEHTWQVTAPPENGILLVDDCRMGGNFEIRSDQSYRNVLEANAPGRYVILDIEAVPRLSTADLDATLSLFDKVVWYTDADTRSSGALQLARGSLEALLGRAGRLFLSSGLAFGTSGDLEDPKGRFRSLFGIESLFLAPDSSTNFAISLNDTVRAGVSPGLDRFHWVTFGLGAILDCFDSSADARSLYWYDPGTLVRATADSLNPYVNPVQYDIGVEHPLPGGAHTVFVSWPAGIPINDGASFENEVEIREMLRLAGILEP